MRELEKKLYNFSKAPYLVDEILLKRFLNQHAYQSVTSICLRNSCDRDLGAWKSDNNPHAKASHFTSRLYHFSKLVKVFQRNFSYYKKMRQTAKFDLVEE